MLDPDRRRDLDLPFMKLLEGKQGLSAATAVTRLPEALSYAGFDTKELITLIGSMPTVPKQASGDLPQLARRVPGPRNDLRYIRRLRCCRKLTLHRVHFRTYGVLDCLASAQPRQGRIIECNIDETHTA